MGKTAVVSVPKLGGKVIAMPVERTDAGTLVGFAEHAVEAGTIVCTGNATAYSRLPCKYESQPYVRSVGDDDYSLVPTNGIRWAWWLLKRARHGILRDVSPTHVDQRVNEEALRLNERNYRKDLLDRVVFCAQQVDGNRLSCKPQIARNGLYGKKS